MAGFNLVGLLLPSLLGGASGAGGAGGAGGSEDDGSGALMMQNLKMQQSMMKRIKNSTHQFRGDDVDKRLASEKKLRQKRRAARLAAERAAADG